ncbi:Hypothetical protein MBVG_2610 [Mycoplasmopsis bovigenitalium 51080]|uniref:Uncharacterized protein n=1 Tax=Mycoplasmopsis bovigenitalium 51080 TaxID=1188235 RepID=N9VEP5_9BACT|nr:type IV secretory system conjugative DNA transfer family protein [Mycoplasmopsis bovigenitalium]ENY69891.1 Hypothetical protein MBVG_2610 [Mycoplasmopsis bovigenitalium 51080]
MKKQSKLFVLSKYVFCLVILPPFLFMVLGLLGQLYFYKFTILKNWFNGSRNALNDIFAFYKRGNNYWFVLLIIVACLILLAVFEYKNILEKFSKKTKDESAFLWNENTNEGSIKKLKKEFANNDEPGFAIGHIKKHGTLVNHTDAHMILLGIAGSGKTWRILFENIRRNASLSSAKKPHMVITDPKGELLKATGTILKDNGYDIRLFDFEDSHNSVRWNPLKKVWDCLHKGRELNDEDYSDAIVAINDIVENLPNAQEKNSYWVAQAKNCIKVILKFMAFYSTVNPEFTLDFFTMKNAYSFTSIDMFVNGAWREEVKKYQLVNKFWNELSTEIEGLATVVQETLSGYLSNAQNALILFQTSPVIQSITSQNNIDFIEMFNSEKPFAIFIKFPDHKRANSFLIPILISQIYEQAITKANSNETLSLDRTLLMIFEEFASIEKLKDIGDWMAISRSRKIFFALSLQDYAQLDKYNTGASENKLIKSQARLTVFLETNNQETLKEISEMIGENKVEKKSTTSNDKGTSTTIAEQNERIFSISDLKFKSKLDALVLSGGYKPILIKPLFAFNYMNIDKSYIHTEPSGNASSKYVFDFKKMKKIALGVNNQIENHQEQSTTEINIQPKNEVKLANNESNSLQKLRQKIEQNSSQNIEDIKQKINDTFTKWKLSQEEMAQVINIINTVSDKEDQKQQIAKIINKENE